MKRYRKALPIGQQPLWDIQHHHFPSRYSSAASFPLLRQTLHISRTASFAQLPRQSASVGKYQSYSHPFSTMAYSYSWLEPPRTPPNEGGSSTNLNFDPTNLASLPKQHSEELLTRRIHLLGTGSIGSLVAHSLRILSNPPPVTILLHREELFEDFKKGGRRIRLVNKKTGIVDDQTGYDLDLIQNVDGQTYWKFLPDKRLDKPFGQTNEVREEEKLTNDEIFIYSLIVTVKGPATVAALMSVKHRVDQRTTILLMQNGMGQIDELNSRVFTDPKKRPTYLLGIISHGAYMQDPFTVVHAGQGSIALGVHRDTDKYPLPPPRKDVNISKLCDSDRDAMFPTDEELYSNLSARYLLRTLTRSPVLSCAAYPRLDLFQLQLEKLVTNCIINPVTALLDVTNGTLLENPPLTLVQRLLIAEVALVIRGLPELKSIPNVNMRFSASRLESVCRSMCQKTAQNSSSMREDIRHARHLEIDYINGYIVKRGEEQGIQCVLNFMLMQLVKAKSHNDMNLVKTSLPYDHVEAESSPTPEPVMLEDKSIPFR